MSPRVRNYAILGAITLLVLAFSFLGDGLRDAFDPHSS